MRVYLFRGLAGQIFSRGMDELAEKLTSVGHQCSVHSWIKRRAVQAKILDEYKSGTFRGAIATIGHSLGGNSANYLGGNLAGANVPVKYIATIDPTEPRNSPNGIISDNFRSNDFRAGIVPGSNDFHLPNLNHIQIDKDSQVHTRIIDMISKVTNSSVEDYQPPNMASNSLIVTDENIGNSPQLNFQNFDQSKLQGLLKSLVEGEDREKVIKEFIVSSLIDKNDGIQPQSQAVKIVTENEKLDRPIKNVLGKTVGNMLDGKKTFIGIAGLLATTVLPVLFPQLAPIKAVLETLNLGSETLRNTEPGQSILTPIFGGVVTWGLFGRIEKWIYLLKRR